MTPSTRCAALSLLLPFSLTVLPEPAAAAGPPLPKSANETFWLHSPRQDTDTVFLWPFDGDALPASTAELDRDIMDVLSPTAGNDAESASLLGHQEAKAAQAIEPKNLGDAAPTPRGRFGGGIRVSGKGRIQSGLLGLHTLLAKNNALTLDFSVNPDPQTAAAPLFALPDKASGITLNIARNAEGVITLADGQAVIATHPRRALPGEWTHIALVLADREPNRLLVNGTSMAVPSDKVAALKQALAKSPGNALLFGGSPSGAPGLTGTFDAIRLSKKARPFYELRDEPFRDPKAARPVDAGLALFARQKPLNAYCSFDNTLKPEEFSGVKAAEPAAKAAFAEGVRGQAVELSPSVASNFCLSGNGAFPVERGTVEFWLKPVDWDNLVTTGIYAPAAPSLTVLRFARKGSPAGRALRSIVIARSRRAKDAGIPWTEMHPGRWTHILCSWNGSAAVVYLDGKPQVMPQVGFAGATTPQDQKDYEAWLKAAAGKDDDTYELRLHPSATLIDELRIYPWSFVPEEANNAFVRYLPDGKNQYLEIPRLFASTFYDYYQTSLNVNVSCQAVNGTDPATVTVQLFKKGVPEPILTHSRLALDGSLRAACSSWGRGLALDYTDYLIQLDTFAADGTLLLSKKQDMIRKAPDWWQNDLGKDPVVPKPWTPVTVAGDTLKVWGRDFTIGAGGLVAGITSAAAQLLAAPPRLSGIINGKAATLTGPTPALPAAAPTMAEWTGELAAAGIRAAVHATLEYDGLAYYTITLRPDGSTPATVDALTLDFPLQCESASQYIINGGGHKFRSSWIAKFIPDATNVVWTSGGAPGHKGVAVGNFCPLVWIGNDQRGLAFFGENDKGWTPGTNGPAQEIIRQADAVVYRMNIINRPVTIEKERQFTFVLHPTPTKALPDNWRSLNGRGAVGKNIVRDGVDAFLGHTLTSPADGNVYGITFATEPLDWETAKKNAVELKKKVGGQPAMFYIDNSWPQMGPSMAEFKPTLWWTGRMTWSREVEDYFVWIINEYLKRDIIDGIYIDDVSFGSTRAFYSTAYLLEDGKTTQPGFNTMGFRRFLQRLWVLFEKSGKQPMILPHMSFCFEVPALSFAETVVNGEDRDIGPYAGYKYPEVWSKEEVRVMGSSEKWGFVTFWKPGVRADFDYRFDLRAREWIYEQSRAMHALMIPHDYWYLWSWPTANCIAPALTKFGLGDPSVTFTPYWNLQGKGEADGKNTLLTIYTKKDKALLMVSNLAKEDQDVKVSIDPQKLFGPQAPATVTWADIDTSLMRPKSRIATKDERKQAERAMLDGTPDLMREADDKLSNVLVDEFLGDGDPKDKERERLAIKPEGNAVRLVVRKQDYRLLEAQSK